MPVNLNMNQYGDLLNQVGTSGSNPGRPLDRWSQVLQGLLAVQQGQFANELEPWKQSQLRQFLMNINPANIQARIDALYRQNRSAAARRQQMDAANAPFAGVSPGTLAAYNAQADQDTARAGQALRSPEGMSQAFGAAINAISGAQDPRMALILSQLQGNMQQSNMAKDPPNGGFGGLLGTIGSLQGMGAFRNFNRGGNQQMNEYGGWSS